MARIMGIDYGTKRTGIAVTDNAQIIASGLETVQTEQLFAWLERYLTQEEVTTIVVGNPLDNDGQPNKIHHLVVGFIRKLQKLYPDKKIVAWEEGFTSQRAFDIILQSGAKQKKRREKGLVDKVSAAVILNEYMEAEIW